MATYVNDLRLKEIATGDESGTWGTSTNTNLELIADAFSYATKDCFASDADATETMADGVADEIRSLYLKVTSSATLTATRTLTLAPNTVSKTWIIENATTGGQSISYFSRFRCKCHHSKWRYKNYLYRWSRSRSCCY
jgi:hypothetical protein